MDKMNLNLRKKLDIPQSLVEEDDPYQAFLATLTKVGKSSQGQQAVIQPSGQNPNQQAS